MQSPKSLRILAEHFCFIGKFRELYYKIRKAQEFSYDMFWGELIIKMEKLILASTSPRRRDILNSIGLKFEVVGSNFNEDTIKIDSNPWYLVETLAYEKAMDVYKRLGKGVILAADTIVSLDGKIYGKPRDENDARYMLESFSGRVHDVITGVAVVGKDGEVLKSSEVTKVFFNNLDKKDIDAYIGSKEYIGKAGAYGIQGKGAVLVRRIEGSYTNVVGLPVNLVCCMLKKVNENIYSHWE